ncbi:MAG: hypothetical protein IKN96_05040 [Oscillibacter sp.]|nr:hypothetical protein [Oscillibacter sp.]
MRNAAIVKRGECGGNVAFAIDENGVLTISGEGDNRKIRVSRLDAHRAARRVSCPQENL